MGLFGTFGGLSVFCLYVRLAICENHAFFFFFFFTFYCSIVVWLEIRNCETFLFVFFLFLWNSFSCSGPLIIWILCESLGCMFLIGCRELTMHFCVGKQKNVSWCSCPNICTKLHFWNVNSNFSDSVDYFGMYWHFNQTFCLVLFCFA